MSVRCDILETGASYDRPTLAEMWGMVGFQAISRGVFTPRGTNLVIFFVTREKQQCLTQYKDFLKDDLLFWEGEGKHSNDLRIVNASRAGDELHLFYRERHHSEFVYHGRLILTHWTQHADKPSEFVFKVIYLSAIEPKIAYDESFENRALHEVREADDVAYKIAMSEAGLNSIDKEVIAKSRGLGQRLFRGSLIKLWQGECAVTGTQNQDVLKASHIKPWRNSELKEKLDPFNGLLLIPNLDSLLDTGLISFEDTGGILISPQLKTYDRNRLNIHNELHLRSVNPSSLPYLDYHRNNRFRV